MNWRELVYEVQGKSSGPATRQKTGVSPESATASGNTTNEHAML